MCVSKKFLCKAGMLYLTNGVISKFLQKCFLLYLLGGLITIILVVFVIIILEVANTALLSIIIGLLASSLLMSEIDRVIARVTCIY